MGRAAGPPGTGQGTSSRLELEQDHELAGGLATWRGRGKTRERERARDCEAKTWELGGSELGVEITDYRFQVPGAGSELGAESSDARMPRCSGDPPCRCGYSPQPAPLSPQLASLLSGYIAAVDL